MPGAGAGAGRCTAGERGYLFQVNLRHSARQPHSHCETLHDNQLVMLLCVCTVYGYYLLHCCYDCIILVWLVFWVLCLTHTNTFLLINAPGAARDRTANLLIPEPQYNESSCWMNKRTCECGLAGRCSSVCSPLVFRRLTSLNQSLCSCYSSAET